MSHMKPPTLGQRTRKCGNIHIVYFLPFPSRKRTFVASCLHTSLLLKRDLPSKKKKQQSASVKLDALSEGRQNNSDGVAYCESVSIPIVRTYILTATKTTATHLLIFIYQQLIYSTSFTDSRFHVPSICILLDVCLYVH